MAAEAVLRITYSLRSSASGTMTSAPRPMKIWRSTGSLARTVGDIGISRSTGTSRQPSSTWPSAFTARSSSCSQARRDACSLGRKIWPTPYSPGGGSSMPCSAISARKYSSGIWIRMPAPSPISLSAPTAPRWSRFSRIFRPCSTIECARWPLMCATKPTPQASCSRDASYSPPAAAAAMSVIEVGCPWAAVLMAESFSALENPKPNKPAHSAEANN